MAPPRKLAAVGEKYLTRVLFLFAPHTGKVNVSVLRRIAGLETFVKYSRQMYYFWDMIMKYDAAKRQVATLSEEMVAQMPTIDEPEKIVQETKTLFDCPGIVLLAGSKLSVLSDFDAIREMERDAHNGLYVTLDQQVQDVINVTG